MKVLVVGDGDFSGARAILQAYRQHLTVLVATTILASRNALLETYPSEEQLSIEATDLTGTEDILDELESTSDPKVFIYFNVDATQLHVHDSLSQHGPYDLVVFQHPHLGYGRSAVEGKAKIQNTKMTSSLAEQHSCLLAHYLYSASHILSKDAASLQTTPDAYLPCIHLCLSSGQSKNWHLKSILKRLKLQHVCDPKFVVHPFLPWLDHSPPPPTSTTEGQRPCLHWLGQYGYRHQATHPSTTQMNSAVNSHHHFFRVLQEPQAMDISRTSPCPVCHQHFDTRQDIEDHWRAPARPFDVQDTVVVNLEKGKTSLSER